MKYFLLHVFCLHSLIAMEPSFLESQNKQKEREIIKIEENIRLLEDEKKEIAEKGAKFDEESTQYKKCREQILKLHNEIIEMRTQKEKIEFDVYKNRYQERIKSSQIERLLQEKITLINQSNEKNQDEINKKMKEIDKEILDAINDVQEDLLSDMNKQKNDKNKTAEEKQQIEKDIQQLKEMHDFHRKNDNEYEDYLNNEIEIRNNFLKNNQNLTKETKLQRQQSIEKLKERRFELTTHEMDQKYKDALSKTKEYHGMFLPLGENLIPAIGVETKDIPGLQDKMQQVDPERQIGVLVCDNELGFDNSFAKNNIHAPFNEAEKQDEYAGNNEKATNYHTSGIVNVLKQIYPKISVAGQDNTNKQKLLDITDLNKISQQNRQNIHQSEEALPIDQAKIITISRGSQSKRKKPLDADFKKTIKDLLDLGYVIVMSLGNHGDDLYQAPFDVWSRDWITFINSLDQKVRKRIIFVGGTWHASKERYEDVQNLQDSRLCARYLFGEQAYSTMFQLNPAEKQRVSDLKHQEYPQPKNHYLWTKDIMHDPNNGSCYYTQSGDSFDRHILYTLGLEVPIMTKLWGNKQDAGFFETGSGTSYATPIVAANLARLVNEYGLSIDQAIDRILTQTDTIDFTGPNQEKFKGKVLNFKKCVESLPKEPSKNEKKEILKLWDKEHHDPLKFEEEFEKFSSDPEISQFRANDVYKIITEKYPVKKAEMTNKEKQDVLREWLHWSEGKDITTLNSAEMIHQFATQYLQKDIKDKPVITKILKDYIQKTLLLKEMNKKP